MAFHIDTYSIPPIRSYGDALHYWGRIKPWRGSGDTNTRPLAGRNKKHMTVRQLNNDAIAFRLHGTDVVIYHPDGSVVLNAYPSISTDAFARCLTPYGVSTSFNSGAGYLLHLERNNTTMTFLLAHDNVRLLRGVDGDWHPTDPAMFQPFTKYRVDTKRARQALRDYNFYTFKLWVKARRAMAGPTYGYLRDPKYSNNWVDTIAMLKEQGNGWESLYAEYGVLADTLVRDAIYKLENCIIKVEIPSVAGYNVDTIQASANKWRRLSNPFS